MAIKSAPFSVRLEADMESKLFAVVAASYGEVSRGEVVNIALAHLFKQLEVCPAMVPGYDPSRDKSVTQTAELSYTSRGA